MREVRLVVLRGGAVTKLEEYWPTDWLTLGTDDIT